MNNNYPVSKTNSGIRYNPRDVMCLCPVCRDQYINRGFKVIPIGGNSDQCDWCSYHRGFDYAVVGILSR